jgi:hypothetical protein
MSEKESKYSEQVTSPTRIFAFLGLLLGITAGVLTGVAIKGIIDVPVVSGGGAVAFYASFAASSIIALFVMLNYLIMKVQVSSSRINLNIGMRSVSLCVEEVSDVRVAETRSRMSRALTGDGRRITQMWTVIGVGSGVELTVERGGRSVNWFVASQTPHLLRDSINVLIANSIVNES